MTQKRIFLAILLSVAPLTGAPTESKLWGEFKAAAKPGEGTLLPDYSYSGYHGNEVPLPVITEKSHRYFNVCDYGAVADGTNSSRDAVLKALAAAEAWAGPAVLYFPPGRFLLGEKSDVGKPGLVITRSNVVLKGAGMARTELFFSEPCLFQRSWILFRDPTWKTLKEPADLNNYLIRGFNLSKIKTFPPRGSMALEVEDGTKFYPGMVVTLNAVLDVTTEGGKRYFFPHEVPKGAAGSRGGRMPYIFEVHHVKSVRGKTVEFAEPIQYDLPNYESGSLFRLNTISEVGVEDLTLSGNNRELFYHHMGSRMESGYHLLDFVDVVDGWVRRVRFRNYGEAFKVERGGFNTFMDLVFEGNVGHLMAGAYGGSYGNLYAFNRELGATWHGPIGNGGADTVAWRGRYFGNMEMHCGFSRATLMDCCEGQFAFLRGGGAKFFPHQGEYNGFWNWSNTAPGKVDFWPTPAPYGYMMPPIISGLHGDPCEIAKVETDTLALEAMGERVSPESLFEAQLTRRLGQFPKWLKEEADRYEAVSHHSSISWGGMENHRTFAAGRSIPVEIALDPGLAKGDVKKVTVTASATALDSGFQSLLDMDRGTLTAQVKLAPGTWALRASLLNSRDEICESRPWILYVDDGRPWKKAGFARVASYVEDGIAGKVQALGLHVDGKGNLLQSVRNRFPGLEDHELDLKFEDASLSAYTAGIPILSNAHIEGENPRIAEAVVDGDLTTPIKTTASYKRSFLFELDRDMELCRMDLVFDRDFSDAGYKVELMGSGDPRSWYTFLNDEGFWENGLVRHGESRVEFRATTRGRTLTFYFPKRAYRYWRLIAPSAMLGNLCEVSLHGK